MIFKKTKTIHSIVGKRKKQPKRMQPYCPPPKFVRGAILSILTTYNALTVMN